MRVVERSEFLDENGEITLENRLRATLRSGLRWYGDVMAQQAVTQRLSPVLGSDHVLIRNLTLPGVATPLPLVLVGPEGVRVLIASPLRGVFRAKGGEWMTFNSGARRFRRVRPNLQAIAAGLADAVLKYLNGAGFPIPEVEPVLVLTDPRTHVDTARPQVRIVLSDAIEHFAANLLQLPALMDLEDVANVSDVLVYPREGTQAPTGIGVTGEPRGTIAPVAVPGSGPAVEPVSSLRASLDAQFEVIPQEEAPVEEFDWRATGAKIASRAGQASDKALQAEQEWERKVAPHISGLGSRLSRRLPPFTRSQWILLGIMAFFEFIILVATVLIIVADILRY
ncbi:MAG: hypothetical protein A2Y93_09855 [Chloroflexi bacterium RBG_13_68_17]|nr:MAG: hypothetical protein A2Y93_09855 [Chloroflexi bacterium RBG_13_68_17]